MPMIDIPDGDGGPTARVWELRPLLGEAAAHMSEAVFEHSRLAPRLRELVRYRIAQLNGCRLCLKFRDPAAAESGVDESLLESVGAAVGQDRFDEREQLAIDFAERFVEDHHSLDEAALARLRTHFGDDEILDLTFCVARFLAFGRLTRVLGLDDSCDLGSAQGA